MSARWGGVLELLLSPVIALANHELVYLASMQSCPREFSVTPHLIPVGAIVLIALVAVGGRRTRVEEVRRAPEVAEARAHLWSDFLTNVGHAVALLCVLVVLAQWLALAVFGSCTRS